MRKPKNAIEEGDEVVLKGRVSRIDDEGEFVTVQLHGYDYPVTVRVKWVEKAPPE